jgi:hypothetical protein
MENPDAIGWQAHKSIVVECNERYFICEPGVIREADMTDTDYGLIHAINGGCYVRVRAKSRVLDSGEYSDERTMLVSALRRIQTREFLTIVPESSLEVAIAD